MDKSVKDPVTTWREELIRYTWLNLYLGDHMRIITVKIPETYLEGLEELVNIGRYTSRSEAIRAAIRDLLKRELWEISSNTANDRENEREETVEIGRKLDRSSRVVRLTL